MSFGVYFLVFVDWWPELLSELTVQGQSRCFLSFDFFLSNDRCSFFDAVVFDRAGRGIVNDYPLFLPLEHVLFDRFKYD